MSTPDVPGGMNDVLEHYEVFEEDKRITRGLGQLELLRTQEIIRRHLPSNPVKVLDVGGAYGVHAEWLARDGHEVHLVDPVPRHVEGARRLAENVTGITAEIADARALPIADESFDVVLILGPLYHLTDRNDRLQTLRQARRVVRPGGIVFAAAITRYASLFDGLARGALFDPEFQGIVERDLREGQHRNPRRQPGWFTTAYFHHPEELSIEAAEAGLTAMEVLGIEGLAGWMQHLADRWDNDRDREVILYSARAVEAEPALRGVSPHLLMVASRRD